MIVPPGGSRGKKFGQGRIRGLPTVPTVESPAMDIRMNPDVKAVTFFIPLYDVLRISDGMVLSVLFPKDKNDNTPSKLLTVHNGVELHYTYRLILHQVDQTVTDSDTWIAGKVMMKKFPSQRNPISPPKDLPTLSRTTIAEVECSVDQDKGFTIAAAYEQALAIISDFQQAYHLATKEPISLISRKSLPSLVPMLSERRTGEMVPAAFISARDGSTGVAGRRAGILNPKTEMLSEEQEESIRRSLLILQTGLLGQFSDVQREAFVAYRAGNSIVASALLGLAAELLVKEVVTILLWERQIPLNEAERSLKALGHSRSFVSEAQKQLTGALGGSWTKDSNEAYRGWRDDVARLRNASMHEGYRPTEDEMKSATSSYVQFQRYLVGALSERSDDYPISSTLWGTGTGASFDIPAFKLRQKLDTWSAEIERLNTSHEGDPAASVVHALAYTANDVRIFAVDEANKLAMQLPVELEDLGFDAAPFVSELASHGTPAPYHVLLSDSEIPDSVDMSRNGWMPLYQAFPETNSLTFGTSQ